MKDTNLIIGKTNSGKTKGILFKEVKDIIKKDENLFIVNERLEYYKTFAQELNEKGYKVYILNVDDPINSNGYDILAYPYQKFIQNDKDSSVNYLNSLAHEIFKPKGNMDPYWDNMAISYMVGLLLTLFNNAKKEEINFGSLCALLNQVNKKYDDTTLYKSYLGGINSMSSEYLLSSAIEFSPIDTKDSILSVVRSNLNNIFMKENLLNMLQTNEIDFSFKDKCAFFIVGNNIVTNILVEQLLKIFKEKNLSFNYIFDNLENYELFTSLKDLILNASYLNNKVYIATKNLEQLESIYGKYLFDKVLNVINLKEEISIIPEGNYQEFPNLKLANFVYFDLEKFYLKKN